jgi:hypothetical protein
MGNKTMNIKMKNYQAKPFILTLAILTSSGALAGNIDTNFNDGDLLTAAQMNEIKNAVNDNDTRLFAGDGSAGDLIVSDNLDWTESAPTNPYFNNITINADQTLTVPAGTTIRCRGNFINNGTLSVAANMNGGSHTSSSLKAEAAKSAPHPGDTTRAAGMPASTIDRIKDASILDGGRGGSGIPETRALTSYNHFQYGGGGGSGHRKAGTDGNGGDGGGLVKINCNGTITNNDKIEANAPTSVGGGGGGGIVILASLTEIINAGTISANGGNGEAAGTDHGSAGGGGGGIIVMIAPSIPRFAGFTSVLGGLAGIVPNPLSAKVATGGGGGGASGGDGGAGGSVSISAVSSVGFDGSAGHDIQIFAIPLPY